MAEMEAYDIMYPLQTLNYYLYGAVFIIKTKHKPLQYLLEADWPNKIPQWALKLSGYNCKIEISDRQRQHMYAPVFKNTKATGGGISEGEDRSR